MCAVSCMYILICNLDFTDCINWKQIEICQNLNGRLELVVLRLFVPITDVATQIEGLSFKIAHRPHGICSSI